MLLEEALMIAREVGDRSLERDVLGALGLTTLALGQRQRTRELLQQELAYAREAGEPFATKAALEHLGLASFNLGDPTRSLGYFGEALGLARQIGDHKHEADLLWSLALVHAALGQRDQAIAQAQTAVDLLRRTGNPEAAWYAHHLKQYAQSETGSGLAESPESAPAGPPAAFGGGPLIASFWSAPSASPAAQPARSNTSLLRMAIAAGKAMAKFLGSGLKTAAPATYHQRLRTCAACEHHTGIRCRLCGCFTSVKARLAHEQCPIGKWPT